MRVFYVGKFARKTATEYSVVRGFSLNNIHVTKFDYTVKGADKLLNQYNDDGVLGGYDFILFSKASNIHPETIKKIKTKKVSWIFDGLRAKDAKKLRDDGKRILERSVLMDIVFTVAHGDMEFYKNSGCQSVIWLPQAVDPTIHKKHPVEKDLDVVFVGNKYGEFREPLFKELGRERIPLKIFGGNWKIAHGKPIPITEVSKVYSRSKVVLGMGELEKNDIDQFSNRVWIAMASGTCLVHKYVPSLEKLFKNGEHLVLWKDKKDCIKRIQQVIIDKEKRERISRNANEVVMASHTYQQRVKEMLEHIKENEHG